MIKSDQCGPATLTQAYAFALDPTPAKFAETWKFRNQQRLAELVA